MLLHTPALPSAMAAPAAPRPGAGTHLAPRATPAAPAAPAAAGVTAERTLWSLTGVSLALLLLFIAAGAFDARTLDGASVWLKPAKFALSFVVLHATLALVVERLSPALRTGRVLRATTVALVIATTGEMAYIAARASLGLASHFATGTPLEAAMYQLMGAGALTLVVAIAVVGWLAGRDREAAMGPGLRRGVAWGFMLAALLTLVTASVLSSRSGHFVGTPSAGAPVWPLLGWSGEVGDLRPAHFLALHAMQALPLLGAWLDRRERPAGPGTGRRLALAASAYAALTIAVFVQALMGLPLVRL